MTLRNIRIGSRIILGVLPVMICLVLTAAWLLLQEWETARRGQVLTHLAEIAVDANAVVHELQRERGSSALFLGSRGAQFGAELAQRRTQSDQRTRTFEQSLDTADAATVAAIGSDGLDGVRESLRRLPQLRQRVDAVALPPIEAMAAYSETIRALVATVAKIGAISPDTQTATLISSYVALTDAKEAAGQERAAGSAGFAAGRFDPPVYRRYVELGAEQRAAFAAFRRYATPEAAAALDAAQSSDVEAPVARMRRAAIDGNVDGIDAPAWFAAASRRIDALKTVEDRIGADIHARAQGLHHQARRSLLMLSAGLTLLLALTGGLIVAVVHSIVRPVVALSQAMTRLSGGDHAVALEGADHRDEVGDMVRATRIFRQNIEQRQRLEAERNRLEHEAAEQRRAMLHRFADQFESTVQAKVAEVVTSTSGIGATSRAMAEHSNHSGGRSVAVGEAARTTKELSTAVSAATVELTASINEIAAQVSHSSQIARQAVADVDTTSRQMETLAQAVRDIGDMVRTIAAIAAQTNMLALNATIEAARAGEAGRGFAVVAGEVKNLATQTARATEDITRHVGAVQESTREMNERIDGVARTIRSLDEASTAIAGAVQQQEASTHEIARNIGAVAQQAESVMSSVSTLTQTFISACAGTIRVIWSAKSLTKVVEALDSEVDTFLGNIRT